MSYASTQFLSTDCSSSATWLATMQPLSLAIASMGWRQQNDTGQNVWVATVLTLTQATVSGGNVVYAFSSYTGPAPRIGMSVTMTGFANGGNNVSNKAITALTGSTSGTFTVVNATGVNETHAGSATTTVTAVPGAGTFVYEIWAPGDTLTVFYFKIGYSINNNSGPRIQVQLATGTNGAGTLSGFTTQSPGSNEPTPGAGAVGTGTYDCYFSGDASRCGMLLWRGRGGVSLPAMFMIERTKNTDGSDSSDGVTLATINRDNGSVGNSGQQTILFGVGAGNVTGTAGNFATVGAGDNLTSASQLFNNNVPIASLVPLYGKYGNLHTVLVFMHKQDIAEGAIFTTVMYGCVRTYISTQLCFANLSYNGGGFAVCMRYD